MNNQITDEFDRMEKRLIDGCEYEVHCINCGDIAMYLNPKHFEGMQLPDMICLKCKFTRFKSSS